MTPKEIAANLRRKWCREDKDYTFHYLVFEDIIRCVLEEDRAVVAESLERSAESKEAPVEYYELVRRKIEPPKDGEFRIATAAVWNCAWCSAVIDGMGGPGTGDLCVPCGDKLKGIRNGNR